VPGCKAATATLGGVRRHSTASVLMHMFSAAFDARYLNQPPRRLSSMLPTFAETVAKIAGRRCRNLVCKCLASNKVGKLLMLMLSRKKSGSIFRIVFSGPRVPVCNIPAALISQSVSRHTDIDPSHNPSPVTAAIVIHCPSTNRAPTVIEHRDLLCHPVLHKQGYDFQQAGKM